MSQVLEAGSLKPRCQHGWVLVSGLRLLTFRYIFMWQESELAFWFLLIRALIPFMTAPSS